MFEQCRPEDAGVDSLGLIRFLDDMKAKHLHMHKMMVLRHGRVLMKTSFAPWSTDDLHMLFSLSKSFTSTAVGFAVQDGLLKTEDRLIDFFPELLPCEPCDNMRKVTVRHLLTMNTGHDEEPRLDGDSWERIFVRSYIAHEPGTHFVYNTAATYMLSAIVQKATGKNTLDYLKEKLFVPLGISPDAWSEESPAGVPTGGYGLNVRIDDIAKLGQFILQKGKWDGKQLLNEEWIQAAQTPWSDNSAWGGGPEWNSGYGYQFWMCSPKNVFRGDGAFGQYCVVCPDQDMVIAINSGVDDMGAVLRSLWENVLPAVDRAGEGGGALEKRLLETDTPADWEDRGETAADPVPEKEWIGSYRLAAGNLLDLKQLDLTDQGVRLTDTRGREMSFALCRERWIHAAMTPSLPGKDGYLDQAAVRAARVGDQLVIHLCYTVTPFEAVLRISFTEHGIVITGKRNVGFGNQEPQEIIGFRL